MSAGCSGQGGEPGEEGFSQTNCVSLPVPSRLLNPCPTTALPGAGPASFSGERPRRWYFPGEAPNPLLILLQFNILLQFARLAAILPSPLQPPLGRRELNTLRRGPSGSPSPTKGPGAHGMEGLLAPPQEQGLDVHQPGGGFWVHLLGCLAVESRATHALQFLGKQM